jgi:hypothetical protein
MLLIIASRLSGSLSENGSRIDQRVGSSRILGVMGFTSRYPVKAAQELESHDRLGFLMIPQIYARMLPRHIRCHPARKAA